MIPEEIRKEFQNSWRVILGDEFRSGDENIVTRGIEFLPKSRSKTPLWMGFCSLLRQI